MARHLDWIVRRGREAREHDNRVAWSQPGQPDVVLGTTPVVRLLSVKSDIYSLTNRDAEVANQISAIAREQGIPADPSGGDGHCASRTAR
jgi:hypothetical protein